MALHGLFKRTANVLGMNRRNVDLIFARNQRRYLNRVDDKVEAKTILERAGIPVPRTIAVVEWQKDLDATINRLQSVDAFALKPARSFGGKGIIVLFNAGDEAWKTRSGESLTREDMKFHMASILSGMYALSHMSDRVLVESLIDDCDAFRNVHGGTGVSDIRVIVLDGRPIMAMLRLPCRASGGRANLHAGGIAAAINLASGKTFAGLQRGRPIDVHPDSGTPLAGITIPGWSAIIEYASRMNDAFELGYLGADFVVDSRRGPLALEVNARPGLDIQLANRMGIRQAIELMNANPRATADETVPAVGDAS